MGLFNAHYDRPGPGVSPDAPRKKGFARLFELLGRDFGSFFKAGMLAFISAIPFIVLMYMAVASHALIFMLAAGIIGGLLAMPQLCGMADTVLRSLRDEPGYWWATYRRSWKRNFKATLMPGVIFGLIFSMQIFTLWHLTDMDNLVTMGVMLLLSAVLTFGLVIYVIAQLALVDISFGGILKNAALLFLGFLPRSMGAVAVNLVYWGAVMLLFPLSGIPFILTNFWLPMLLALFIIYPPLEKSFNIEATIKTMRDKQLEGDGADK